MGYDVNFEDMKKGHYTRTMSSPSYAWYPYTTVEEFKRFTHNGEIYWAGRMKAVHNAGWIKVEPRSIDELIARAKELLDEGGEDRLLDEFVIATRHGGVQFYPRDRPRTDK